MAAAWAVQCEDVGKSYGSGTERVAALRQVTMQIPFGRISLLVGPSGCGKTTLISIVAALLTPDSGRVVTCGTDLASLQADEKAEFRAKKIGFVFQQYNLIPTLTAVENAAVPLIIGGRKRKAALAASLALLDRLGMADQAGKLPRHLSGGQQQRVAFARALVHDPALVICDEPTAALDAERGRQIMQMLADVAVEPGRAVLVVTHDTRILGFAGCVVHMEDGAIVNTEPRPVLRAVAG